MSSLCGCQQRWDGPSWLASWFLNGIPVRRVQLCGGQDRLLILEGYELRKQDDKHRPAFPDIEPQKIRDMREGPWARQLRFTSRGGLNLCIMRSSLEYEEQSGQTGKTQCWHQQKDSYHLSSPALGKTPLDLENISSPLWWLPRTRSFPVRGELGDT